MEEGLLAGDDLSNSYVYANMVDAAGASNFTYDGNGNLLTEDGPWSSDTVTLTLNEANQVRTLTVQQPVGSWITTNSHDAALRLTQVESPAGIFAYTHETGVGAATTASPLIRKIALPNTGWITNVYDTLGRLTDTSLRSSTNVVLNQHRYQYSGHLRSKRTRTGGSYQDYTHDGGGNITALVAASQTLSATYKYDPYGRSLGTSGSMACANTQRFSSKEIIPSTGFYYYGYRFYDPEHQRWLNRDPLGEHGFTALIKLRAFRKARLAPRMAERSQGPNLYAMVGNGPVNRLDSFGLKYDEEQCKALLSKIDHLFTLKGRVGMDDNSIQQQINEAQDEYDDNCGDDDDDPNPQPNPVPVPACPKPQPRPHPVPSFCQRNPAICIGVPAVIGIGTVCALQPALCSSAIRIGLPVLRIGFRGAF